VYQVTHTHPGIAALNKKSSQIADPIGLSRRYVASGGTRCPACNSSHLSSDGELELIGAGATQGAKCDDCNSTWLDVYHLVKIADLVDRKGEA